MTASSASTSSSPVLSLDNSRHYCSVCLTMVQSLPAAQRHVSQIQSYSKSTSTTALTDHLSITHDIKLAAVGVQFTLQCACANIRGTCPRRGGVPFGLEIFLSSAGSAW